MKTITYKASPNLDYLGISICVERIINREPRTTETNAIIYFDWSSATVGKYLLWGYD